MHKQLSGGVDRFFRRVVIAGLMGALMGIPMAVLRGGPGDQALFSAGMSGTEISFWHYTLPIFAAYICMGIAIGLTVGLLVATIVRLFFWDNNPKEAEGIQA